MTQHRRIAGLDTLRALAILWVIGLHCLAFIDPGRMPRICSILLWHGDAGVDLFFVLSGFLITSIMLSELRKTGRLDVGVFWQRRWFRTLPAYYATLAVIVASDYLVKPEIPWRGFPAYLVFLQNNVLVLEATRFGWSWSLCVEEGFYLFLPLLVVAGLRLAGGRLSPEGLLRSIGAVAFVASIAGRAYCYWMERSGAWPSDYAMWRAYFMTPNRLDGLAVGVIVATLPRLRASARLGALAAVAAVALVAVIYAEFPPALHFQRFALLALIFGAFVLVAIAEGSWLDVAIPGVRQIADLSYSLYLTHPMFVKAVRKMLGGRPAGVQFLVFLALTLAASLALRHLVELPFLRLRDRLGTPRAIPKVAARSVVPQEH